MNDLFIIMYNKLVTNLCEIIQNGNYLHYCLDNFSPIPTYFNSNKYIFKCNNLLLSHCIEVVSMRIVRLTDIVLKINVNFL